MPPLIDITPRAELFEAGWISSSDDLRIGLEVTDNFDTIPGELYDELQAANDT